MFCFSVLRPAVFIRIQQCATHASIFYYIYSIIYYLLSCFSRVDVSYFISFPPTCTSFPTYLPIYTHTYPTHLPVHRKPDRKTGRRSYSWRGVEWIAHNTTKFKFCSTYYFRLFCFFSFLFFSFFSIIFRVWRKLIWDVCIKIPSDLRYVREYFLGEERSSTKVVEEASSFNWSNF